MVLEYKLNECELKGKINYGKSESIKKVIGWWGNEEWRSS